MINFTTPQTQEEVKLSLCSAATTIDSEVAKYLLNPYWFVPVNVLLSLAALSGNILILIGLHKVSSLHPPSKLLFYCLSSTDLCVGLISQPIYITYLTTIANRNWDICVITEGLAHAVNAVLCGESISTLTAISVDRLLALLLRLRYKQIFTLTRVRIFAACSWITLFCFALTYIWNKRFFFLGGCLWILVCLVISTCCYTKIYLTLSHQQAEIQDQAHGQIPGSSGFNIARYKKTVSNALWIHVVLIVCYLPYAVGTAVGTLGDMSLSIAVAWNATGLLVFFNSSLNPFLYYWKIRGVRQAVKATIRKINIFAHNE